MHDWDVNSFYQALDTAKAALEDPMTVIPKLPEYLPTFREIKRANEGFLTAKAMRSMAIWTVFEHLQQVLKHLRDYACSEESFGGIPA